MAGDEPQAGGAGRGLAIWRRIKLVPFEVRIPPAEQLDKDEVHGRLRSEGDGILAWMVEGWRLYLTEGLTPEPDAAGTRRMRVDAELDDLEAKLSRNSVADCQRSP